MNFILNEDDLSLLEPIEPGIYRAIIEDVISTNEDGSPLMSKSGNTMIIWVFRVLDVEKVNNILKMWTVTTKGKNALYLRTLKTLLKGSAGVLQSADVIGAEVNIEVTVSQSNNGDIINNVKRII